MITPERLAIPGTESAHQQAVMCWAAMNEKHCPELRWLHHIPNGGVRGDDDKGRNIRGAKLKAEGVKEGVADLFLPVKRGNFSGLYIEMKKPGGKPSLKQVQFGEFVLSQGYYFKVCDSWVIATQLIEWYLRLKQ